MANELIPRQQAVYPSNDMQITQSPLVISAYSKSGALAFSSGKETPQGIMSDTMYSVPMKGTRPFCSYLDVVKNPEAANIVRANRLGEFTGNMKCMPNGSVVNEVQFNPEALQMYDPEGVKSYMSRYDMGAGQTQMVQSAKQNLQAVQANRAYENSEYGHIDTMTRAMMLSCNMQDAINKGDDYAFASMMPEYAEMDYRLNPQRKQDVELKTQTMKSSPLFAASTQETNLDIQKAMYTAQLVKQLSDTKNREQRTAKQQFMTSFMNTIAVNQMVRAMDGYQSSDVSKTRQFMNVAQTDPTVGKVYETWQGHIDSNPEFMTKDSFDKYNDMMTRGGFASDQLRLEQLKDANRLPGAEQYAIPEKGKAMAIEGQNQPLLPQMDAATPQLAHPERGTEFAGMLSGPSAPSSTFEFGN